jgi:hypothetical protein
VIASSRPLIAPSSMAMPISAEKGLRHREVSPELLARAAIEVTLVHDAAAVEHDERAGSVLLEVPVQPDARGG